MKKKILAVHEQNLDSFLESVGLLHALETGKLRCGICGSLITRENFRGVFPEEGELKVCCSILHCYKTVLKKLERARDA